MLKGRVLSKSCPLCFPNQYSRMEERSSDPQPQNPGSHSFDVQPRGIMPIQSEGARAPSDFWAKWILNAASKRQKIAEYFFIYIWYNHTSVIRSFTASAAKFKSAFDTLAGAESETDAFEQHCITPNHTRFCCAYECNEPIRGVRMSHHWNAVFCSLDRLGMVFYTL